ITALSRALFVHSSMAPPSVPPSSCRAKSMIMVVPPAAADSVPVAQSSAVTVPPKGMSMWVWASMKPGMTNLPEASTVSAPSAGRSMPTATIFSSSTSTSARKLPSAVTTVPPVKGSLLKALSPFRSRERRHDRVSRRTPHRGSWPDILRDRVRSGIGLPDQNPGPEAGRGCSLVARTSAGRAIPVVRKPALRARLPSLQEKYRNGGAGCKPVARGTSDPSCSREDRRQIIGLSRCPERGSAATDQPHGLCPIVGADDLVGGAQVLFCGRFGEKEPLGYLGVAKPLADQTQYLLLARREDGARRRGQPRVLAGHPDRHHRTQDAGRASEAPGVPRFPYGLAEPAVVLVVAEGVGPPSSSPRCGSWAATSPRITSTPKPSPAR